MHVGSVLLTQRSDKQGNLQQGFAQLHSRLRTPDVHDNKNHAAA
jgi:hypothetical protein